MTVAKSRGGKRKKGEIKQPSENIKNLLDKEEGV